MSSIRRCSARVGGQRASGALLSFGDNPEAQLITDVHLEPPITVRPIHKQAVASKTHDCGGPVRDIH